LPYHRIPRARLHEDIVSVEREGERVTACTLDGDDAHVFTCYLGEQIETRPLTSRLVTRATPAARSYTPPACTVAGCRVCGEPS
jgi:hypothetical protein